MRRIFMTTIVVGTLVSCGADTTSPPATSPASTSADPGRANGSGQSDYKTNMIADLQRLNSTFGTLSPCSDVLANATLCTDLVGKITDAASKVTTDVTTYDPSKGHPASTAALGVVGSALAGCKLLLQSIQSADQAQALQGLQEILASQGQIGNVASLLKNDQ